MSEADREVAKRRVAIVRCVGELIAKLEELLDGRSTRAHVLEWARDPQRNWYELRLPYPAGWIVNALYNLEDRDRNGREFVGELELRTYLATMRGGVSFVSSDEAHTGFFMGLAGDIDTFAARIDQKPVHWLPDGIGWQVELWFGVPSSGRTYIATCDAVERGPVGIQRQHHVAWRDAVVDLFEGLALDERDATWLHPEIDLTQLPRWALWREDDNCNQVEIERSYSFAKLEQHERTLRERGHRQLYWIDPAE